MAIVYNPTFPVYDMALIDMQNAFGSMQGNASLMDMVCMLRGEVQYQYTLPIPYREPNYQLYDARTNCRNCGAVLPYHHKCEYCGTIN